MLVITYGITMKKCIAIIGAGMSGLTIAKELNEHAKVVVFEKSRGIGGRMSTRYSENFSFDHGTQYFTVRTTAFQKFLNPYFKSGNVDNWMGDIINLEAGKKVRKHIYSEDHLVATPNMNSLCKSMSTDIDVRTNVEVAPVINRYNGLWILQDKEGNQLGEYDWVISTAPPAQTIKLLKVALPDNSILHNSYMEGCFSLMIGSNNPWDQKWIAAKVHNNPIQWISINSTKPFRNKLCTSVVVHSSNEWAEKHLNDEIGEVQSFLLTQFEELTGIKCSNYDYLSTHLWRYAISKVTTKPGVFIDDFQQVAATGDWVSTSRIEDVWLNANNLAEDILSKVLP